MPVYDYTAIDAQGKARRGIVSADSRQEAQRKLRAGGLYPTGLREGASAGSESEATRDGERPASLALFRRRVSGEDMSVAMRQLSGLLGAGFPLLRALELMRGQTTSKALFRVLSQVCERIKEGSSLSAAMLEEPGAFTPAQAGMVRAAEASGALDTVMSGMADLMEQQQALRRKIMASLAYPGLMLVVGVGVVGFLMAYVIPNVARIFTDLKHDLPQATVILMAVSSFIESYWPLLLIGAALCWFGLWRSWRSPRGRPVCETALFRFPVLGSIMSGYAMVRFARTLGSVLENGLPIIRALDVVAKATGSVLVERDLVDVRREVGEGMSLAAALGGKPRFPGLLVQMAAAGEQSGALDRMLKKAADIMEDGVKSRLAMASALFEPLLILALGMVVGFIVVAVLLPIFEISSLIG
ncbi:type II secretion system F family protein [Desulfovibrio sulfodismutans]|uniref:General secretion pathway protein F n=1 Tax=Desulfolutivibrio sulfodismutans TaxID=63561 RepID=A0A7K3NQR3_9BACT|nr:type II secretion system F family protein [Desulfolutivibrio sulfodismutans]NDY58540.1 type II secretion system F family protein [Desulfolutivibrio sulfodismutans]QLA14126.1 type II secretion system protein GspF [Desulfolutivibrio sulfodismutans DSM 3696]